MKHQKRERYLTIYGRDGSVWGLSIPLLARVHGAMKTDLTLDPDDKSTIVAFVQTLAWRDVSHFIKKLEPAPPAPDLAAQFALGSFGPMVEEESRLVRKVA